MQNKEFYNDYIEAFLKQNAKLNLISKNDEKFLWEKHIFDSLSIEKFFEKYGKNTILICRLLPFVSFDIVSYAAGLTSLSFRQYQKKN